MRADVANPQIFVVLRVLESDVNPQQMRSFPAVFAPIARMPHFDILSFGFLSFDFFLRVWSSHERVENKSHCPLYIN